MMMAVTISSETEGRRDDPGRGCAVLAVGAEIARETAKTRRAFAGKVAAMIEMLAEQMEGVPAKQARQQASAMLASMVGTLLLARVTGAGELSDEILAAGRAALPVVPAPPRRGGAVTVRGSRAASLAKTEAGAVRPAVQGKKPVVRRAAASKTIASKTVASKAAASKVAASKAAASKALAGKARAPRRGSNGAISSQQR